MREKNKKLKLLTGIALTAIAAASIGVGVGITNSTAETYYTVSLDATNSPADNDATIPTSSSITSLQGNNFSFTYTNCLGSNSAHATILEGGSIKNTTLIGGIDSITTTATGNVQYRTSIDNSSWTSYVALVNGTTSIEPCNYIEIAPVSDSASVSFTLRYSCVAAESGTKYNPANYYNGYYSSIVSWTDGADLEAQLHNRIRDGYTAIKYEGPNWNSNKEADHSENSYLTLDVVYSDVDADASLTQTKWQREHAFCASLMTGSLTSNAVKHLGRATDFHNLFAGDASGNGSRGNKNFGVADTTSSYYTDRTTNDGFDGYSYDNKNFEPGDKDKGRVARALFYMCTMYNEVDHDEKNNVDMQPLTIVEDYVDYQASTTSGNNCAFAHGNLSTMLDWAINYSVDTLEMQHNTSVQTYQYNGTAQGNRNPYVDYPELVDYVYGSKKNQAGRLEDLKPAAVDLGYSNSNKSEHRSYVLKSAKDKYTVGTTFTSSDVVIYDVKKDFTYTTYTGTFTSTLDGHTFSADDGATVTNTLNINGTTIPYVIKVEGMTVCSFYHEMKFTGTGITDGMTKAPGTGTYTWNGEAFTVTFVTDGAKLGGSNRTAGGCTMGSGTSGSQLRSVTIESTNAFSINQFYVSACVGNTASTNFSLKMYVGTTEVISSTITYNSAKAPVIHGGEVDSSLNGKLKIEITGSNCIIFEAFAFNVA